MTQAPHSTDAKLSFGLVRQYFNQLREVIFRPSVFFRGIASEPGTIGSALAFGLISHWIGSALDSLRVAWMGAVAPDLSKVYELLDQIQMQNSGVHSLPRGELWREMGPKLEAQFETWMRGTASTLLDPFKSLIELTLVGGIIFVAARIFITPKSNPYGPHRTVQFSTVLQILAYSMAPAWLIPLPLAGDFAYRMASFVLAVIGFREVYRTTLARSLIVVSFPHLVLFFLIFSALFAGLFAFIGLLQVL